MSQSLIQYIILLLTFVFALPLLAAQSRDACDNQSRYACDDLSRAVPELMGENSSDGRPMLQPHEIGPTWVEIDGETYGAKPDERGPIGGREGYQEIFTDGDYRVRNVGQLVEALAQAEAGEVVFIEGDAEIDCTVRMFTDTGGDTERDVDLFDGLRDEAAVHSMVRMFSEDGFALRVPAGVTLASNRGHQGAPGALIFSDAMDTYPMIEAMGEDVRITGLRIQGPDQRIRDDEIALLFEQGGRDAYYQFPEAVGIYSEHDRLKVDNSEIYGWSFAGILLQRAEDVHIHHNYVHHNHRRGLGYGVEIHWSKALIERNLFDYNRHSIAADGYPGEAYTARHNVVLKHASSHAFDMHGAGPRGYKINHGGDRIHIYNNQFRPTHVDAVRIRGIPREEARIHNNWFFHEELGEGVISSRGVDNTHVYDNVYGKEPQHKEEAPGFISR